MQLARFNHCTAIVIFMKLHSYLKFFIQIAHSGARAPSQPTTHQRSMQRSLVTMSQIARLPTALLISNVDISNLLLLKFNLTYITAGCA